MVFTLLFLCFLFCFLLEKKAYPCGDNESVQRVKTSEYPYCWLFLDIQHISCARKNDASFLWKNPKWH